jgi:hypothetical protein
MVKITIEETLASSNVTSALTNSPYLIYSEVLEGARRPLVFLQVVKEIKDLIGTTGNRYQFLSASQRSASKTTESSMLSSGMASGDKSLSAIDVSVTDVIYCAAQLSDFLKEDYPNINWIQMNMQNMGKAVMEYLDALVYSTIHAASGTETFTATSLGYDEIVDALTEAKDEDWIPDAANPPFLIMSAGAAGGIVKDSTFVSTERYTTANVARMVAGETGLIAGCRVMETSLLAGKPDAYIVFPDSFGGPVVALIWKRELKVTNIYVPQNGYTYFNTSIRAIPVVVQAKGIVKIRIATSP